MTTHADRLHRWNRQYERTPQEMRFQLVAWTLVVIGAVNMLLTIAFGFPFGLLLVLAIAAMAVVRVPHALGWLRTGDEAAADAGGGGGAARMEIEAPSWVHDVNRWYDGLPEARRPLVLLAALAIPGALNMLLTIAAGFPFGLLFLLALLALIAIRAPYVAGWYKEPAAAPAPALAVAPQAPRIADESAEASLAAAATRPAAEGATVPAAADTARPAAGAAAEPPPPPRQGA
jgi:pyruvate/2-oxoglutarate dehydrogenase complex dihydrolipoamide acyltransferase (E2) component